MSFQVNITLIGRRPFAWQSAKLWQDANRRAAIFSRFWSKVQRADAKACWEWTGHVTDRGRARRFSYWASRGGIPVGMTVYDRCGNACCVNPGHLFIAHEVVS